MKTKSFIITVVLICLTVSGLSSAPVVWGNEVYFVAADDTGNNYYLGTAPDGTLSTQILLGNTGSAAYGNGIGDFDNDGDFDYIVVSGMMTGNVHLFEKLAGEGQFAPPVNVGTWSGAYLSGKMAVADFNEDGFLDFILTYYYSEDAHLYLGDGNLGFGQPITLTGTTPFDSIAADAADFDNDGHADFVSAPSGYIQQIYVNFGDGRGNFETVEYAIQGEKFYAGIAAADFNGDGSLDLAATAIGCIDIYWGDADQRSFTFGHRIDDPKIWDSPIDNFDLNSDGMQDLILGSYDESMSNTGDVMATFIGDGTGNFTLTDQYDAGDDNWRIAMAAPAPPKELPNEDPIAYITTSNLNVTAGQPIEFSADGSYDPDGVITGYSWDFGNANAVAGLAAVQTLQVALVPAQSDTATHTFHEVGDHTVTLTVTDDKGASNSAEIVVHVTAPVTVITAKVVITPKVLNLNSKGRWIKAYIRLPKNYNGRQIDPNSLVIVDPATGQKIAAASFGRYKRWWRVYKAKFDRQAVIQHIQQPARKIPLEIQGRILTDDGTVEFTATGKIKAVKPKPKKKFWRNFWKRYFAKYWKR